MFGMEMYFGGIGMGNDGAGDTRIGLGLTVIEIRLTELKMNLGAG